MRNHLTYDGTSNLNIFLTDINFFFAPEQRISVLDIYLKDTPARWWATYKYSLLYWEDTKRDIRYKFVKRDQVAAETNTYFHDAQLFNGKSDPIMHVENCIKQWKVVQIPSQIRVQFFSH